MMQPMPEGAQAPAEGAPAQSGGGPAQLVSVLSTGMKKLGSFLEKAGVDPEKLQEYAGLIHSFEAFVDGAMGGEESEAPARPAPSGAGSVEAGGNPNARPM